MALDDNSDGQNTEFSAGNNDAPPATAATEVSTGNYEPPRNNAGTEVPPEGETNPEKVSSCKLKLLSDTYLGLQTALKGSGSTGNYEPPRNAGTEVGQEGKTNPEKVSSCKLKLLSDTYLGLQTALEGSGDDEDDDGDDDGESTGSFSESSSEEDNKKSKLPPIMMGQRPLQHWMTLKTKGVSFEAYQSNIRTDGNVQYLAAGPHGGGDDGKVIIIFREYRIGQSGDPLISIGHTYTNEYCKRGTDRCISHFIPTRALRESVADKPLSDVVQRWPTDIALNAVVAVVEVDVDSPYNLKENRKRVADFFKETYYGLPWDTLSRVNFRRPAPNHFPGLRPRVTKEPPCSSGANALPPTVAASPKRTPKRTPKPKPGPKPKEKSVVIIPTRSSLEEKTKAELYKFCEATGVHFSRRAHKGTIIDDILKKFFPQSSEDKDCKKDSKEEEDDSDASSDDDLGTARLQQLLRDKAERERRRRAANKAKIQQQIKKLEEETGETNLFPFTI